MKAELLRKQAEVNKAKTTHSITSSIPKKRNEKTTKQKPITPKQPKKVEEYEDTELLKKSRRVLEAKTKLYNKMSANGGGGINSDDTCLVMFNHKKQSDNPSTQPSYRDDSSSSDADDIDKINDQSDDGPGEWVEYTDCLGRTRKCLKEDLEFFKKKDIDLADTVAARQEKVTSSAWFEDTKGSTTSQLPPPPPIPSVPVVSVQQKILINDDDNSTIASKIDEMRSNWDKQEEENINKDFVHYQDILFDGKGDSHKLIVKFL